MWPGTHHHMADLPVGFQAFVHGAALVRKVANHLLAVQGKTARRHCIFS